MRIRESCPAGGSASPSASSTTSDFSTRRVEQIEHLVLRDATVGARRLGGVDGKSAGENGEPAQQCPLVLVEQVVAPVDQRAQGLLARKRAAVAPCQQLEAVTQVERDLLDRHRPYAGGSELDGQREAVEAAADFGNPRDVLRGDGKPRTRGRRAVGEQAH
jgi:hypothetical protein